MYSTFECISSCCRFCSCAACTTAFAIECGKCSSRHAAMRSNSSGSCPLKDSTLTTVGFAFVSVPVLSNTIVCASAMASRYRPPFTVTLCCPASRIAESTEIGIASFSAQEKSTIRTDSVFVTFLVSTYVSAVPASVYGTRRSARCSALLSSPDFSFSDSSIIFTIFSKRLAPPVFLTSTVNSPSSTTVPA